MDEKQIGGTVQDMAGNRARRKRALQQEPPALGQEAVRLLAICELRDRLREAPGFHGAFVSAFIGLVGLQIAWQNSPRVARDRIEEALVPLAGTSGDKDPMETLMSISSELVDWTA